MKRRGLNDLTNHTKYCQFNDAESNKHLENTDSNNKLRTNDKHKIIKKINKKGFYFVNEFSQHIFMYLMNREMELFMNKNSMVSYSPDRIDVMMWLISVANKTQISNDSIHLAIALFDRYYQQVKCDDDFCLYVGVIVLWIASKIEDSFPISLKNIINQTNLSYDEIKTKCFQLEFDVLIELDFNVNIPTPIQFLRHFTKIAKSNESCHQTAKFIIDLTLTNSKFIGLHYSLMAASSFCIALDLVKRVPEMGDSWNTSLKRYTSLDKSNILPVMKEMVTMLININKLSKQLIPLYKRYSKTVDSLHLSKDNIRNYQYKIPLRTS